MPIRVLHVTENHSPVHCGVGDFARKLSYEERKSCKVESFLLFRNGEPSNNYTIRNDLTLHNFEAFLRELSPDIIHFHVAYAPSKGLSRFMSAIRLPRLCHRLNIKIMITYHQFPDWRIGYSTICKNIGAASWLDFIRIPVDYLAARVFASVHRCADSLFVVDKRYLHLMPLKNRVRTKYIEIPSNIQPAEISVGDIEIFKMEHGMLSGKWIGFFGFLFREKGFEYLIELLQRSTYNLLYVGEISPDNAYRQSIVRRLREKDLQNRVVITGYLDESELPTAFSSCGAFVFPFIFGCSPKNASVKAVQAQGVPIITTSTEAHSPREPNVFYVNPGDIDAMILYLDRCYGHAVAPDYKEEGWRELARSYIESYEAITRN